MMTTKLIIHAAPENYILAVRCANYLVRNPECNFVISSFGDVLTTPDYLARRSRTGTITVKEIARS
jgi:hypothetical protein